MSQELPYRHQIEALTAERDALERQVQLSIKLHHADRDALKAANAELVRLLEASNHWLGEYPSADEESEVDALHVEVRQALAKHRK